MFKDIRLIVNTFDNNGIVNGIKEVNYSKKDLIDIINKFNQNNAVSLKNNNYKIHKKNKEKIKIAKEPLTEHKKEYSDFLSIISKKSK